MNARHYMAGMFTSWGFLLADDEFEPWTVPVVDHGTFDDCYFLWLVSQDLLTCRRWRLPICRTISREPAMPDLLGVVFVG